MKLKLKQYRPTLRRHPPEGRQLRPPAADPDKCLFFVGDATSEAIGDLEPGEGNVIQPSNIKVSAVSPEAPDGHSEEVFIPVQGMASPLTHRWELALSRW